MRLFRKVCFVLLALVAFLPAISVMLPEIVGNEGAVIELGSIDVSGSDGEYVLTCEADTWADYLVAPLFSAGSNAGVSGAFIGVLATMQDAGVPLSTPVVLAVGLALFMIVVELVELLVSLFMWVPRRVTQLFERS